MSAEKQYGQILVTGADGFVGRNLCRYLTRGGYSLRAAVREPEAAPIDGVDYVVMGTIDDQTDWGPALDSVDAVVHAAGTTEDFAQASGRRMVAHNQINVAGTASLAQAAMEQGVRRLLFLSSVGVRAAEREEHPTAFQQSKWEAEQVLRRTVGESPLQLTILRLPPLYGPDKRGILWSMGQAIAQDRPLPFADVQNQMSLLFIGNLVSAIESCLIHPNAAGRVFAVSDGEVVSTPEIAERLGDAMGREVDIWSFPVGLLGLAGKLAGHGNAVRALTEDIVFDDQEIAKTLSWEAPIEVDTALRATVQSWRLDQGAGRPEPDTHAKPGLRDRFFEFIYGLAERAVRFSRNRRARAVG